MTSADNSGCYPSQPCTGQSPWKNHTRHHRNGSTSPKCRRRQTEPCRTRIPCRRLTPTPPRQTELHARRGCPATANRSATTANDLTIFSVARSSSMCTGWRFTRLPSWMVEVSPQPFVDEPRMRFITSCVVGLAASCAPHAVDSSSPPTGFEHAYAAPDCAPWDGYAVSLVLRRSELAPSETAIESGDDEQLRLGIYPRDSRAQNPTGLKRGTVSWPAEPQVAGGTLCASGRCAELPRGIITIRDVDVNGRLTGSVDLTLPGRRAVRGTFQAEWRQRTRLCG